ncbi:MAG: hypothetical protein QXH02_06305 [Desulfurococcaceae archaeon]
MEPSSGVYEVGDEEKLWGFIAWLIPLIGGVLVLVLKPGYRYAKHWAYLSISFFILIVAVQVACMVFALIPFVGWAFSVLINLGMLVVWVLGIVKSLGKTWWKPPVIYDLARMLGA